MAKHNLVMDGNPRTYFLPRLAREFYQGDAVVHWTLTVFNHGTGWLNESFHWQFRELLLHAAAREGLLCPVYCLMPDHLHLVWMGLRADSDQKNGMAFLRTHLEPLLAPHRFQPRPSTVSCVRKTANGTPLQKSAFTFWTIRSAAGWWPNRAPGFFAVLSSPVIRSCIRWQMVFGKSFGKFWLRPENRKPATAGCRSRKPRGADVRRLKLIPPLVTEPE